MNLKYKTIRTFIQFLLLFLVANNAYSQEIKRIKITHNGGSDYSLGHLFLFNGATQYVTDYGSTISAGSNDFAFNYNVQAKRTNQPHIENLVRQGTSYNQKKWDGTDYNETTWLSSGSSAANTYVEVDFGSGGQVVTDIILTAWVKYGPPDRADRIYHHTIEVYDGSDTLIQTYNLGDSEYSSSGKFIFHITTNESDVNINSVKASLPDTNWNANGGSKAVYTLADLTPAPDTTAPTNQNTVFASAASASGGDTVTIVSSADTTNNVWFAPADTTTFTAGATMTKATNGVATSILAPATAGTYYLYVLDAAGNTSSASTAALTVSSALPSPLNKTDVTDSIKAMSGIAIDTVQMNFTAVDSRIAWLSSNISSNKLSHQGVRLSFANPTIDKLMNTAYVEPGKLSPTNKLLELLRNNLADGTPDTMAMTEDTKAQLNSAAFNEAAKLREETIGKVLNATGGSVMGDWNVWTEGRITVGKTYSTDTTSEQDSQTQNISLGFDRIIKDDNQSSESAGHIVGVVLGLGKSDADTTNNSTVDADSYSISTYGVIRQDDKELVQAQIGYGHIKVDKTRIDGSDTLTGSHNANQFFTSLMVKRETMSVGSFSLSPYGKIQASRTWYDGYSESGGATALTYGEQTIDSTVLSAGVDVDYMIPIHKGNIRPFAKFEYGADVSGSSTVNMHYNNEATNYQLQLDNKADSNWKFVLGADMYTREEWDSSISYERTEAVNAGYSDSLAVKVGLKF